MPNPERKSYEDLKNDESIQSDHHLQNLIKQIDEIKDTKKDNDKIEGIFTDTPEGQVVEKSLNEGLKKSLYLNPDTCRILADEINKLLNDSNLQLNDDIKNNLVSLGNLLKGISGDSTIIASDKKEAYKNSVVDVDFLKSLSISDINSLFNDDNFKEIKKDLIKKENGKEYIIIKGECFIIGEYGADTVHDYKNDNVIVFGGGALVLGNINCYYTFNRKYNKVEIFDGKNKEVRLADGQTLIMYNNPDGTCTRSSNEINISYKRFDHGNHYFYGKDGSELVIGTYYTYDTFCKITSILSTKKNNKNEKCSVINDSTIKIGDETYEFIMQDVNNIAEWINNYLLNNY